MILLYIAIYSIYNKPESMIILYIAIYSIYIKPESMILLYIAIYSTYNKPKSIIWPYIAHKINIAIYSTYNKPESVVWLYSAIYKALIINLIYWYDCTLPDRFYIAWKYDSLFVNNLNMLLYINCCLLYKYMWKCTWTLYPYLTIYWRWWLCEKTYLCKPWEVEKNKYGKYSYFGCHFYPSPDEAVLQTGHVISITSNTFTLRCQQGFSYM